MKDLNRGIRQIEYNSLNLPSSIRFENSDRIDHFYAAGGTKLRTTRIVAGDTAVTDYCGNVVYENGKATRLLTETGYVTLADHKYHYYVHDHQGNVRVVMREDGTVEEVNYYYPYGGTFASPTASVQPYKYNGKELDTRLQWYDYGARMYDPAIGRWHAVDPLAEKYPGMTAYGYCAGNPVKYVDVDGKEIYFYMLNASKTGYVSMPFESLPPQLQRMIYGFASMPAGYVLLQNFVNESQTFRLNAERALTIKGNGNNYNVNYSFDERLVDIKDGNTNNIYGRTEWSVPVNIPMLNVHTDVNYQSFEEQVATFGHENFVHVRRGLTDLKNNKSCKNMPDFIKYINSKGDEDHMRYANNKSVESRLMKEFLGYMKGWVGGGQFTTDKKLENAFKSEYENKEKCV